MRQGSTPRLCLKTASHREHRKPTSREKVSAQQPGFDLALELLGARMELDDASRLTRGNWNAVAVKDAVGRNRRDFLSWRCDACKIQRVRSRNGSDHSGRRAAAHSAQFLN